MSDKPRLTVRPSRHGFVAQASRGGERAETPPAFAAGFVIAQEAPTRSEAEVSRKRKRFGELVLPAANPAGFGGLAAEAMAAAPRA